MCFSNQHRLRIVSGHLASGGVQLADQGPTQGMYFMAHDLAIGELNLNIARALQITGVLGVGAQETAKTGITVADDQRRPAVAQQIGQNTVRGWIVLFHVVRNQMFVAAPHMLARLRQGPNVIQENLHLQGKIEQIVRLAVFPKCKRAGLRIVVDMPLFDAAGQRCLQPRRDLRDREAHHRRLVHIVNNLAIQPGAVDSHAVEVVALVDQRLDDPRHKILHRFQAEEIRQIVGMAEAGALGDQEPEGFHHLQREAADGLNRDLSAAMLRMLP